MVLVIQHHWHPRVHSIRCNVNDIPRIVNQGNCRYQLRPRSGAVSGESLLIYALIALPLPGRLRANMPSSTKPEVHNILQRRQRRTETRPQATFEENLIKIACVFPDIYFRRDKQTDIQMRPSQYFRPLY